MGYLRGLREAGASALLRTHPGTMMLIRNCLLVFFASAAMARAQTITVQGSPLIAQVLKAAEPFLKEEYGFDLRIGTEGGSTGGFFAVGTGTSHLGMTTKEIEPAERAQFPACAFAEVQIGWQVLGIGVARDVWEGGVHALSREQMVKIYEGDIRNWKEVGGPDSEIKFYNPKRGRGTWELFATWLYKDQRLAPLGDKFETVVRYEDARDSVEFNASSISVMPPQMANGDSIHILAIKEPDGSITEPTPAMLSSRKYPLAKPLMILSPRKFAGNPKKLADWLVSPRGQAIVKSAGFVPVSETAAAAAARANGAPGASRKFAGDGIDPLDFPYAPLIRVGIGTGGFIVVIILLRKLIRLRASKAAK